MCRLYDVRNAHTITGIASNLSLKKMGSETNNFNGSSQLSIDEKCMRTNENEFNAANRMMVDRKHSKGNAKIEL